MTTIKRLATAAALACALGLSACGGSTPATSPAPAPEAPGTTPSSSSSASPSASTSAAGAKDPCKVISTAEMSEITGTKIASQRSQDAQGLTICAYLPDGASNPVTAIEGKIPGGADLDSVFQGIQAQSEGSEPEDVSVEGAEEAKAISAKAMGANQYFVLATKGGILYGSQVLGDIDAGKAKTLAITITETLIKG